MKRFIYIIMLMFSSSAIFAQEANAPSNNSWSFEMKLVVVLGTTVVLLMISVVLVLLNVLSGVIKRENAKRGIVTVPLTTAIFKTINQKFITGNLLPVDQEESNLLPHTYDGIQELNNGMPPWLKFIFSFTIVTGIAYLSYYYVFNLGFTQVEEYQNELKIAAAEIELYNKTMANSIDETNVKLALNDKKVINEGKIIFEQNCKACHGGAGEGGVGPNLTDEYWIHGATIASIFKTIKVGVPEKGMISWQQKLRPLDIQNVSNYILSLKGTNPINGKAPQGVKTGEQGSINDTTKVKI